MPQKIRSACLQDSRIGTYLLYIWFTSTYMNEAWNRSQNIWMHEFFPCLHCHRTRPICATHEQKHWNWVTFNWQCKRGLIGSYTKVLPKFVAIIFICNLLFFYCNIFILLSNTCLIGWKNNTKLNQYKLAITWCNVNFLEGGEYFFLTIASLYLSICTL